VITIALSEFGLMTVTQVAVYHNASRDTVWRWIAEDWLPVVPIDRGYLVRRADCERFQKPKAGRPSGPGWNWRKGRKKNPAG
jgi:excisionase family DNA binding protein